MKLRYKISVGLLAILGIGVACLALVLRYDAACESGPPADASVETMQAIVYRCYGSPDVLALETLAKPVPDERQVLVRVRAAGVNPLDWHYTRGSPYIMRLGTGIGTPDEPRLGVDFAGTVEAVGANVSRFKPGDEVFGGRTGAFGEYVVLREDRALALKPGNVTYAQAAAVPIAGLTALQALRDEGHLQPGQQVLINGASGGVGTFAVQLAKAFGAEVTGVCSTRNVDLVRSIGADHVIDYTREDYTKTGRRYDLIIDNVGNHSPLANARVLKAGGTLVLVGGPKGDWIAPLIRPLQAMFFSPFVEQNLVMFLAQLRSDDLATLADMIKDGSLTPVIDRHFSLADVPAALRYSEAGRARGKIVIDVN